jgi:hypothetical protein
MLQIQLVLLMMSDSFSDMTTFRSPNAYVNQMLQIQLELLMMSSFHTDRPVTTCVCKPDAANTVRAPDDERFLLRHDYVPVTKCVCKPDAANTVRAPDDEQFPLRPARHHMRM